MSCGGEPCAEHATCTEAGGELRCECKDGFIGNGIACSDAAACGTSNGGCDPKVSCTAEGGAISCGTCPLGYEGNGTDGCVLTLTAPIVEGETSAGHLDLTWRWGPQDGVVRYEVLCVTCGAPEWKSQPAEQTSYAFKAPSFGTMHTIAVRACTSFECTDEVTFGTKLEDLTAANLIPVGRPAAFAGVARDGISHTAIRTRPSFPSGHPVAFGCASCIPEAKTIAALGNEADVVEVPVAEIAGKLELASGDQGPSQGSFAAWLDTLAARQADTALLALQVAENSLPASEFARVLLAELARHPTLARNGRPLWIVVPVERSAYLDAIEAAAASYPFLRGYLRYWLRYSSASPVPSTWYDEITKTAASGRHGVMLHFQSANLMGAVVHAHSQGLAVGIHGVPGPGHGDAVIASLREDVDYVSTNYHVGRARALAQSADVIAWFNAADSDCVNGSKLVVHRNDEGTTSGFALTTSRDLGIAATSSNYGSPELSQMPAGDSLSGRALRYSGSQILDLYQRTTGQVLMTATARPTSASVGILITGHNPFIWGGSTALQVVTSLGSQRTISYSNTQASGDNTCNSANGKFAGKLDTTSSFVMSYAYDTSAGGALLINGGCAGSHVADGAEASIDSRLWYVGGIGGTTDALGGYYFFDGYIQQVMIAHWKNHASDGVNP